MTSPTDPQAAISRLRATLPSLKTGFMMGLAEGYPNTDHAEWSHALAAFAADIETLTSLTYLGEATGYAEDGRLHVRIEAATPLALLAPGQPVPVYARLPAAS